MEVLGAWINNKGATNAAFQHRAKKAEKAYWADKGVLLNKAVSLYQRLHRYSARIVPRLLHSCGSWAWSQSLCQSLTVLEGKLLRRIV
eukprot:2402891-Karenia_brevis.AAC.1